MSRKLIVTLCSLLGVFMISANTSAVSRMEWGERDASYNGDIGYNRYSSGAAWYYYEIPSNYNGPSEVQVPFNTNFNTKTSVNIANCKGYGGFYILMRNEYNRTTGALTGKPAAPTAINDIYDASVGWTGTKNFVRYMMPSSVDDNNGVIRATGVIDWNTAADYFSKVRNTSAVPQTSSGRYYQWNQSSGLTYFCYSNSSTISYSDGFHSYSSVAMGDEYNSTPIEDGTSYLGRTFTVPKNSEITVTFHHYLSRKEQDASEIPVNWTITGSGNTGSGTIIAKDIQGTDVDWAKEDTSVKEILNSNGENFKYTFNSSSRDGERITVCQTIRYSPANYTLSWDGAKYNYSSAGGERSSTACVTVVSAESNYVKDGQVAGQPFNCQSGGGASFVSTKQLGNTTATVGLLKNNTYFQQTTASGHDDVKSVYAKPGDTVQFFYALCFGAHKVQAAITQNGGSYYTRTDGSQNVIYNFFRVYNGTKNLTEGNTDFLFGRSTPLLGKEIRISNNAARSSSGLNKNSFKINNTNDKVFGSAALPNYIYAKKQEVRFASPDTGTKDYDSVARGAYDCFFYSGITNFQGNSQASSGYQIPGFQLPPAGQCSSAGLSKGSYGQGQTMNSVVGATINQSLEYNNLAVWRAYLSKYSGKCACNENTRNYEQRIFTTASNWSFSHAEDSYYEKDVNTADRLFNAYYNAYTYQGFNKIGRYKVPVGNTTTYVDGNYSSTLCKLANKQCKICYGSGKNRVCTPYNKYNNTALGSLKKAQNVFTNERVTKTASVIVPYNFDTELTANITNSREVLYAGETVTTDFNVNITPIANPLTSERNDQGEYIPYATITPNDTQVQVAEFLVRDVTNDGNSQPITPEMISSALQDNYGYTGKDLCNYIWNNLGLRSIAECQDQGVKGYDLENCASDYCEGASVGNNQSNPDGEQGYYTAGKSTYGTSQFTKLVPDVKAGYKYCTVVGINYGNSHGGDNNGPFKSLSDNPNAANFGANSRSVNNNLNTHVDGYYWHISAASCRTIAKKPSFQVWNGGLFSSGNIKSTVTRKYANSKLGDLTNAAAAAQGADTNKMYYFGSWDQYYVVAKGTVDGFASASAMGYGAGLGTAGFGTDATGFSDCDFLRLTIANTTCGMDKVGGKYTGDQTSSTALSDDSRVATFVSQIIARYTKSAASRTSQPSSVNAADDSFYENLSDSNSTSVSRYLYVDGDFAINNTITQTVGTRVIHVKGHVSINRNICLGSGNCQQGDNDDYKYGYSQNTNNLSLLARNTADTYSDISQIPQVIIIADSIGIGSDVNQIDAWLISANTDNQYYDGGYVNTCDIFTDGVTGSGECWKTLKINGPVVSRALLLNRTGGAWAGLSGDIGNPAYDYLRNMPQSSYYQGGTDAKSGDAATRDLSCDGSITPAEIFDLHPLVYLWSYYQAQRFTQAITTYSSEYAPRF